MSCLRLSKKIELFERFGIVSLQILDSCLHQKKVLIIDGRQPFDYVTNRKDIRFHPGDQIIYARIRYFTEEDHLKNLEKWFREMGYYNVMEVGDGSKTPETPEVTISGSISTFVLFPYVDRTVRDEKLGSKARYTLPIFYFRNNSGYDCDNRRVVSTIRRSIGPFAASSSRDCECGMFTSSDFFWTSCVAHRGLLEITGSPTEKERFRYRNIRHIRDGQLYIHDTKTVSNLNNLNNLEDVQCESKHNSKPKRELSAVRIGGSNIKLTNVTLPKLKYNDNCERLVSISGSEKTLPKYSESEWMKSNAAMNSVNINREDKKCKGYLGKTGQLAAEFTQQLDDCQTIEGNLIIDGSKYDPRKVFSALRNVQRITGNVFIRNIDEEHSTLLANIRYIDGNFIYDNNPSLKLIPLSLIHVNGTIKFTRVPQFCQSFLKIRSSVVAFRHKTIQSDCPSIAVNIFSDFEEKYGEVDTISDFGIAAIFAIFVCYMMPNVLFNQLKSLNFTRWRAVTDLDLRLKMDNTAYLDELSSDEEPDAMTWKRKTLMKNRLDGKDVEGGKLKREKEQYRKTRKGIKWTEKMGTLARTLKRRDSDSEFSGQDWLRRKQKRKRSRKFTEVDKTPFPELVRKKKWVGMSTGWEEIQKEHQEKEIAFIEELNKAIRDVINRTDADEVDVLYSIMERIQKRNEKGEVMVVSEYDELEAILEELEISIEKADVEKWNKLTKIREKLRAKALLAHCDEDLMKITDVEEEPVENPARLNAGVEDEEKRRDRMMFAKVIIETMHWRPPNERRVHYFRSTTKS
uniref:Recep_L_domain domain-containing protein n=1 Tax=Caenorhabditis tropicalis TaxID=1561998 RepID=A0A1I7TVX7_9PELO